MTFHAIRGSRIIPAAAMILSALWTPVRADLVIEFQVTDLENNPLETIDAGDEIFVNILLSVTADDAPLPDVRFMQFDLRGTDPNFELVYFHWRLRLADLLSEELYDRLTSFPNDIRATYLETERVEDLILDLDVEPKTIARVQVIARGTGLFDVVSASIADLDNPDEGVRLDAGFGQTVTFSTFNRNVQGGARIIQVRGGQDGNDNAGGDGNDNGADNDNVSDNDNDSGDNENDANDNDGGSGNGNANQNDDGNDNGLAINENSERNLGPRAGGPDAICGVAMPGTMLMILLTLLLQKWLRSRAF